MGRMWHAGYGYRRHWGGFFWPGLLLAGLFLLVFGKFLFPLLLLGFFIVPFIFWMKAMSHHRGWGQPWGEKPKRGEWDGEEKPKRHYRQTAAGEWVEIV